MSSGYEPIVATERNARSSPLIFRVFPVTVSVAVDRISVELLPALSSIGPGSITSSPENPVYASTLKGTDERDGLRLAGLQVKASEPDELLRRKRHASGCVGGVELHDLGPLELPRIGHGEGSLASPLTSMESLASFSGLYSKVV